MLYLCDLLVDCLCTRSKKQSTFVVMHHCRQAITTEPQRQILAFRKPCLQPFATPVIDHNYPKQDRIIILVAFRESIWNMHAHGHYYLASYYYNYFEHDSSLILVKRINLLTNDPRSITVVVIKEQIINYRYRKYCFGQ